MKLSCRFHLRFHAHLIKEHLVAVISPERQRLRTGDNSLHPNVHVFFGLVIADDDHAGVLAEDGRLRGPTKGHHWRLREVPGGGERVERLGGEVGEGDGTGTKTQIVCN